MPKASSNIRQKTAAILTSGGNVRKTRVKSKAARTLFMVKTSRKVAKENVRDKIISGDQAVLSDVLRKSRGMTFTPEEREKVAGYWSEEASHPTTDTKRSTVRKRIGVKEYLSHTRHIAIKSTREAFLDFHRKNPDLAISESSFFRLKPFFVKVATARDLEMCCCQLCTSVKKSFRALMTYRTQQHITPVFSSVHDLIQETLCPKVNGEHNLHCLQRKCDQCGVSKLVFDPKEVNKESTERVNWWTFGYVTNPQGNKRLALIKKSTSPFELVEYFKKSLVNYPYHIFTSKWQRIQWKSLLENLPADHVAVECDFSENYSCTMQEEVQSLMTQLW